MEANKDLRAPVGAVTEEQKESTAITVMRTMLLAYAKEKQIPMDQAILSFSESRIYAALFDFETGIWREGPAYLRGLYEREMGERSAS